jgi:hypothetical protein
MYFVDDKKSAIKEVQRYLVYIAETYNEMPYTQIDGIYSEETKAAVEFFQESKEIEVTGYVNEETFRLIVAEYSEIKNHNQSINGIANDELYPLKRGDAGESVKRLNSLIGELSEYYDIPILHSGEGYTEDTVASVKLMQKIFGFSESGETDIDLLSRIVTELNARENFKKAYKTN